MTTKAECGSLKMATYLCGDCGSLVDEMTMVLDDQTWKPKWVCEECSHKYDELTDPDCMID